MAKGSASIKEARTATRKALLNMHYHCEIPAASQQASPTKQEVCCTTLRNI